ncbi:hypothetical protein EPI10_033610 [Gossypium australe]|uniref:Uncharacterized protein n=1 Tax=Gossypium australe TaxID=47621 RepID=A0A5B6X9W0_9ROSI|nr:hypothetical protein EPI10_033610 [Gossypium australe]
MTEHGTCFVVQQLYLLLMAHRGRNMITQALILPLDWLTLKPASFCSQAREKTMFRSWGIREQDSYRQGSVIEHVT